MTVRYYLDLPIDDVPGLIHLLGNTAIDRGHGIVVISAAGLHRLKKLPSFASYVLTRDSLGFNVWIRSRPYIVREDAALRLMAIRQNLGYTGPLPKPDGCTDKYHWWWRTTVLVQMRL